MICIDEIPSVSVRKFVQKLANDPSYLSTKTLLLHSLILSFHFQRNVRIKHLIKLVCCDLRIEIRIYKNEAYAYSMLPVMTNNFYKLCHRIQHQIFSSFQKEKFNKSQKYPINCKIIKRLWIKLVFLSLS